MQVKIALNTGASKLSRLNSPILDAEILLSFVLKKTKEYLYTHPETKLNWIQKIRFFYLINKRSKNWPVATLTGVKEFYGRNFCVNKNVLVPRPLTEELIDQALNYIKDQRLKTEVNLTITDIGTGSGNIIISLIKELQKQNYDLDKFKFYASDVSQSALKVAKKNAKIYQVDKFITFLKGSLLKPYKNIQPNLILANLPYLDPTDLTEPSIKKEPVVALIGNYDEFFKQVAKLHTQPIVIYEDKNGVHHKK
ncbi:MAG: HemK/PrmC family methyltransferase [Patescibacteria group bacterium]|jgi:release factor glutamine methyltransferase